MNTIRKTFAALALLSVLVLPWSAYGQGNFIPSPAQQIPMTQDPPTPANINISYSGPNGPNDITYFVVATTARGIVLSQPATLRGAGAISASNTVIVTWSAVPGATTYDLLKLVNTTGLTVPCTCRLTLATTTRAVTDTGAALQAYTLGTAVPLVNATIGMDNQSRAYPYLTVVGPVDSTQLTLAPSIDVSNGFATAFVTSGRTTAVTRGSTVSSLCTGTVSSGQIFMPYQPVGTACNDTSSGLNNQLLVAGTSQATNLRAVAVTGGVTAASGVVTLLRNGVATGLSCTIGTGLTCSNTSTRLNISGGDILTVVILGTAGETLANVLVSFDW